MRAAVPFCEYITNDSDFSKKMSLARRRGNVRTLFGPMRVRPLAFGSTQCNLCSPLSFTAYGVCVRRDGRGGDCLPDHCEWRVAKKFHLAPDLSERAAPRPADDAVAMLHASSGRLECDPWPNRQCLSLNGEPAEPFFSSAGGLVQFVAVSAAPMPYARPACLQRRK